MIETDPLSLLFVGCFLVGLVFLLITTFLGQGHGHGVAHHVGHNGHISAPHVGGNGAAAHKASHIVQHNGQGGQAQPFSLFAYINPLTLVLFLVGFGFFGYILHNTTALALPLMLLLAGVSGFIIAALFLILLSRLFGDSEGATVQDVSDRTGLLGKVSMTVPQNGMGEVIYVSPGGMRKSIPAHSVSGQRLERGQEVVVVSYQQGVAEVDTWEHFINQEEAGLTAGSDASELATLRALLEEPDKNDTEYAIQKDQQKE